jgi:H+-translocating NAD(P) transhydrogenase subunit alpha
MAAENGGNVFGTQAGKEVRVGGAHVVGPVNLPSRMPVHTSEMIAKNLLNFITPMIKEGLLSLDWTDDVVSGTALTHGGEVRHPIVRTVLGFPEPAPAAPETAKE